MKWIKKSNTIYACPVCNSEIEVEQGEELPGYSPWNYCPNCGAKMDGERREENA